MWMAVGLMIAGLIAIIIEFFVPAGGLVGVLGLASIIGGVVYAFINYGTTAGSILRSLNWFETRFSISDVSGNREMTT